MTLLDQQVPQDALDTDLSPSTVISGGSGATPQFHRSSQLRQWFTSDSWILATLFFGLYFTIAWFLDWKYLSFQEDSVARMANGFYILHARDPHLAAVGFVWGPLSSVADLPLLLFNSFWPALASHDVAGTTMSAIAMSGAVYQLNCTLREWSIRTGPRVILTLFFAANPLILLFGGNGMSEGWYLFFMLATTRYFTRWFRQGDLTSLVYAACTLGTAYLDKANLSLWQWLRFHLCCR